MPTRKWWGNLDDIVNWTPKARQIYQFGDGKHASQIINKEYWYRKGITWGLITSTTPSFRIMPAEATFDKGGSTVIVDDDIFVFSLGLLNSKVYLSIVALLNPTINFQVKDIRSLPLIFTKKEFVESCTEKCITFAQNDWDSYETSWNFQTNPLLTVGNGQNVGGNQYDLSAIYIALRRDWQRQTEEMRRLEIENNRIFIDAYGLQDELSSEVPWNEITLTCNPWYRYGKSPEAISVNSGQLTVDSEEEAVGSGQWTVDSGEMPKDSQLEARLLEDTIKEFISYAVGCMMGRYSPEKPGLILANQGESIDDYHKKMGNRNENIANGILYSESTTNLAGPPYTVKECCGFSYHQIIDCDGVIPILDEEWFIDDIVAQFKSFLKFTFGMEHFTDNLNFIEKALGKDIRKYFIKDFYKDHVQRYKKRPIYWMFSSPKGSFNALIYMHRYRPDTVSIVLNEYLREFISKIRSHREHLITENNRATLAPAEKTRNLKLIDKYAAMLTELDAYERDILYPLAQQKIAIDLDNGVKVNYCKFGAALKKIPGLEAKEE